jgi:hypothetical protein
MEEVRTTIYDILSGVNYGVGFATVSLFMERPEVIESFPTVTYRISDGSNQYNLDRGIGKQDTEVVVDIWTETPKEGDAMLVAIEGAMKAGNFLLTFVADVPDPSGISHITTRFNY